MKPKKIIRRTVGQFPVIVQEDELGGYWVNCPTLEGCYSQGETIEQALHNIREAIILCLQDLPERGRRSHEHQGVSLHLVKV